MNTEVHMISLKQTAASATGSGLSILAKAARLGIGFPYYILNTVIATFFVMMIFSVFGLGGDTSYWKIGLMLASILFIVPVVLRSLDYKQAREFLAWVIDKEQFNSDLSRYAEKIKQSTKLSDEQKSSITGSFKSLGDDLKNSKPTAIKTALAAFHVGIGKMAGILPALAALSDDFEEIEERVEGGKAVAGCIRPPFLEFLAGALSGVTLIIASFL